MKIIGLGGCGYNLAKLFEKHSQYDVYKIDTENRKENHYYCFKKYKTPEEYEKNVPNLKAFFKGIKRDDEVMFIVGGGGLISCASLAILEQIKNTKINILYVKPDISLLNTTREMIDRTCFGILQQYARSGVFEKMIIVSNTILEKAFNNNIPVMRYYDALNEQIVGTIHMINVFSNSQSVLDNFSIPLDHARLTTIGVVDMENKEERLFFDLEEIQEKQYFYGIPKKRLEMDGSIRAKVKEQIQENKNKVMYGIYSTDYESVVSYVIARSFIIQGEIK